MSTENKNPLHLRQATLADLPFLRAMCFSAAFPSDPEAASEEAFYEAAKTSPWISDYIEGWGHEGDFGLIAVDAAGKDIGAAWYRRYEHEGLPPVELSIAVRSDSRRRHVGEQLLEGLVEHARKDGIAEVGLQVEPTNTRAIGLYQKLNFVLTGRNDGYDAMAVQTASSTTPA